MNVLGILQRGDKSAKSRVRAKATKRDLTSADVREVMNKSVKHGTTVYSDAAKNLRALMNDYIHEHVNHEAREWTRGKVHSQGMENFWMLFKRTFRGTYTNMSPQHLPRYLDEQARRFNDRGMDDAGRFRTILPLVAGKRLTYAELTGNDLDRRTA